MRQMSVVNQFKNIYVKANIFNPFIYLNHFNKKGESIHFRESALLFVIILLEKLAVLNIIRR